MLGLFSDRTEIMLFPPQLRNGIAGFLLQGAFPREVLFGGRDLGPQPLRLFTRAAFLRLEIAAFVDQFLQSGGAGRFLLSQFGQTCRVPVLRIRRFFCGTGPVDDHTGSGGDRRRCARTGRVGFAPAQQEQQGFGPVNGGGQVAVAGSLARLSSQRLQLRFHFTDDVAQAREVLLGLPQAQFRLVPALMQAGNSGGFLKNGTAGERLLVDQNRDLPLADEGRGGRAAWMRRRRTAARPADAPRAR